METNKGFVDIEASLEIVRNMTWEERMTVMAMFKTMLRNDYFYTLVTGAYVIWLEKKQKYVDQELREQLRSGIMKRWKIRLNCVKYLTNTSDFTTNPDKLTRIITLINDSGDDDDTIWFELFVAVLMRMVGSLGQQHLMDLMESYESKPEVYYLICCNICKYITQMTPVLFSELGEAHFAE